MRDEFDEFVSQVRKNVVQPMMESAFVAQVYTDDYVPDVKFAVEIGMAILLNKPVVAVVMPGAKVPEKLEKMADRIVYADIDTDEGREIAAQAIKEFMSE